MKNEPSYVLIGHTIWPGGQSEKQNKQTWHNTRSKCCSVRGLLLDGRPPFFDSLIYTLWDSAQRIRLLDRATDRTEQPICRRTRWSSRFSACVSSVSCTSISSTDRRSHRSLPLSVWNDTDRFAVKTYNRNTIGRIIEFLSKVFKL